MDKRKNIAVFIEFIPIISTIIFFVLFAIKYDSPTLGIIRTITMLVGFLGLVISFIARKIAKPFVKSKDKTIEILSILDVLSTLSIILFYSVAFLVFAL